jgi:quinol monooxygenase YgiN
MSVVVVATAYPAEGHHDAVADAFVRAIEQVHGEPGCELYSLNVAPDRLVMIEKWTSAEALQTHSTSAAIQQLVVDLNGKLARALDVQVLEPRPAGTPAQGVL